MLPILIGVLLLVNLLNNSFQDIYFKIFTGNYITDSLIGALAGSISFGIPITSYIIGGELLDQGINLLAITAFMMTWSTVGVAMLPLETNFLGNKFAIVRNALNFVFAIIISILTIILINFF
ncbi:MAG: hypothetical protein KAT32_03435 [Candidatus Moranbacteria bacterium]|nr:hypothetical protein [Candidatus Moranbacteria bacterium]